MILENILGVPLNYWVIMLISHAVHVYMKVEMDVKTNKIAAKEYYKDGWKLTGVLIGLTQSIVLLIAGHDAYQIYLIKQEESPSFYISFVVAFIGYGGSSLWNNIMNIIKTKIDNVSNNQ
jgi:hypothetical protein